MSTYWTYILASKLYGTLYAGVTNGLVRRVEEHRDGVGSAFTRKYKVHMLVWFEVFGDIDDAIRRETQIKSYYRDWKIKLIERDNPRWVDLYWTLPGIRNVSQLLKT